MCVFSFSSFLYIVYVLFHAFWGALFACLSRNVAWFNWTPTVCLTNPDSDMRGFASWGPLFYNFLPLDSPDGESTIWQKHFQQNQIFNNQPKLCFKQHEF